jgi:hypothetical protein
MLHWDGGPLIATAIRTTGPDPFFHEICQLAMIPFDSFLVRRKGVMPLLLNIRPEYPERLDSSCAYKTTKEELAEIMAHSFTQMEAIDQLEHWLDKKLDLKYNRSGYTRCKIHLLGYNLADMRPFLVKWLGYDTYSEWFSPEYRDLLATATVMNDIKGFQGHAEVPFFHVDAFHRLARTLKMRRDRPYNPMTDALLVGDIYRKICQRSDCHLTNEG